MASGPSSMSLGINHPRYNQFMRLAARVSGSGSGRRLFGCPRTTDDHWDQLILLNFPYQFYGLI